jgi:hypothetical protein
MLDQAFSVAHQTIGLVPVMAPSRHWCLASTHPLALLDEALERFIFPFRAQKSIREVSQFAG